MKIEDMEISQEKKLVFHKLFDLMCEFKRICEENGLKYSLYGGTMLGAIRHQGFIPWDDDVDIIMMRKDYDRFQKLVENGALHKPYFLQSPDSDEGSPRMFLRLRDSSTTSISYTDALYKMNHGIFIDIFPADYYPNSNFKRKGLIFKKKIINKLSGGYARFYSKIGTKGESLKVKNQYALLFPFFKSNIITSRKMFYLFNKISSQFVENDCFEIADSLWTIFDETYHWNKKYFEHGFVKKIFNGEEFLVFKDYDYFLKRMYGDYMTLKKEPTAHGSIIQITDTPYDKYISEHFDDILNHWKCSADF